MRVEAASLIADQKRIERVSRRNQPAATMPAQEETVRATVMNTFALNFSKLEREKRLTTQTSDGAEACVDEESPNLKKKVARTIREYESKGKGEKSRYKRDPDNLSTFNLGKSK